MPRPAAGLREEEHRPHRHHIRSAQPGKGLAERVPRTGPSRVPLTKMSCTPPKGGPLPFSWLPFPKGVSYHQCCEIKVWCAKCLVFAQSDYSYRSRHSLELWGPPAATLPPSAPSLRLPRPSCSAAVLSHAPTAPSHRCLLFHCSLALAAFPAQQRHCLRFGPERAPFLPEAICLRVTGTIPAMPRKYMPPICSVTLGKALSLS